MAHLSGSHAEHKVLPGVLHVPQHAPLLCLSPPTDKQREDKARSRNVRLVSSYTGENGREFPRW